MKTILLADDSVTIQKVVELTFSDVPGESFAIVTVGNGDDALQRLREARPDLVIADVHMPGADGLEVCRRARQLLPPVPVLLLVGSFEPFDPALATRAGASGYLKKPFDSQELLRRVQELLAQPTPRTTPEESPVVPFEEAAWEPDPAGSTPLGSRPEAVVEQEFATRLPLRAASKEDVAALGSVSGSAPVTGSGGVRVELSDEDVDRLARRVVELLSEKIVREVAWEVVPDLAEVLVKDRIRELEATVD